MGSNDYIIDQMRAERDKSPAELIAEVLDRWTVTDLREMSDADLDRGLEQVGDAFHGLRTVKTGTANLIRYWLIESDSGATYQVRRFENFVWCSCLDFFFKKTVCRHIASTTKDFNRRRAADMDAAPYLKAGAEHSTEKCGSVRI